MKIVELIVSFFFDVGMVLCDMFDRKIVGKVIIEF